MVVVAMQPASLADMEFAPFEGVGHVAQREDPARAASAIAGFFEHRRDTRPPG